MARVLPLRLPMDAPELFDQPAGLLRPSREGFEDDPFLGRQPLAADRNEHDAP